MKLQDIGKGYIVGWFATMFMRGIVLYQEAKQTFCKHKSDMFGYCAKCGKQMND